MNQSELYYLIRQREAHAGFRTAVSLHGHTMHSRESTAFIERIAKNSTPFRVFMEGQMRKYARKHNDPVADDLGAQARRMWWTSPLSAGQAFEVEREQIRDGLGLRPIVSLSDHDNIEAPLQLQMLADNTLAPISVEWSTPYEETYFHLGIHNMHPSWAGEMMQRMERLTAEPDSKTLGEMLRELSAHPDVLIVFNHPYWDQPWLGAAKHEHWMRKFVEEHRDCLHALEINGLRSWTENRKVLRFAEQCGLKLISGGDRHGREPNATINLTNASTFAEFVDEFRNGATSHVLVMPQYHDPLVLRVLQTVWDVLRDHPEHAQGRVRWSQRVYRLCRDGESRSLDQFFNGRDPFLMRQFINIARFLTSERVRPAWRRAAVGSEAVL